MLQCCYYWLWAATCSLGGEGKSFWHWRPVFLFVFFYEFLFKKVYRFFYCRASIKIINFNQRTGFTFTHMLNIYKYVLLYILKLGIIQKWCNRKTCCNGNGTGNCFFKLRYNLKVKFCRLLFFRRAYGEFGHINVFPGKWWKIRDKNLEQYQLTIFVKYRIGDISNWGWISLYFWDYLCNIGLWIGCNKSLWKLSIT